MPFFLRRSKEISTAFLLLAMLLRPSPSNYIPSPITHYRTLLSISIKLTTRVADLRTSRGDLAGASRAQAIAQKMESLRELSLWKVAWSLGLSHLRNNTGGRRDSDQASEVTELLKALGYLAHNTGGRRDSDQASKVTELLNALGDLAHNIGGRRDSDQASEVTELLNALGDLARLRSISERLGWVARNYDRIFTLLMPLLEKLREWGPLSEVVDIMQKEAREGKFVKDCLELLAGDYKVSNQFLKDYTLALYSGATADSKMAEVQATAEEKPQNQEPIKQSMWWIAKPTTEEKPQNHEPAGTLATKQPMWFTAYTLLAVLMMIIFALMSNVFGEKTKNPTRHARRKAKRVTGI